LPHGASKRPEVNLRKGGKLRTEDREKKRKKNCKEQTLTTSKPIHGQGKDKLQEQTEKGGRGQKDKPVSGGRVSV